MRELIFHIRIIYILIKTKFYASLNFSIQSNFIYVIKN